MFRGLYEAILTGNSKRAERLAQEELRAGADATKLVYEAVIPALDEVGKRFDCNEYFVPELLIAGRAAKIAMQVLAPALPKGPNQVRGCAVAGTAQGELHDLGIGIICTMLEAVGFKTEYLGVDVCPDRFVVGVREHKADLVLLSASNLPLANLALTIMALEKAGLRGDVKVMVGGTNVTQAYADHILADGYAANVVEAVNLACRWFPGS